MAPHPLLPEEMIVRNATCTGEGKYAVLTVEIDWPRLLFCVNSGRTWRSQDATPADGAGTGIHRHE